MIGRIAAATALALGFADTAHAANVAGVWSLKGDVFGNDVETICTFQAKTPQQMTVSCMADGKTGAETPAIISGDNVTWSWDAGPAILTFKGRLMSDGLMSGDIKVRFATGSFSAVKQ